MNLCFSYPHFSIAHLINSSKYLINLTFSISSISFLISSFSFITHPRVAFLFSPIIEHTFFLVNINGATGKRQSTHCPLPELEALFLRTRSLYHIRYDNIPIFIRTFPTRYTHILLLLHRLNLIIF